MIAKTFAAKQIRRLSVLPFPPDEGACDELIAALRIAKTETIAAAVIDDLIAAQLDRWPVPALIRHSCYTRNDALGEEKPLPLCGRCNEGWIISYWLLTKTALPDHSWHTAKERLPFTDAESEYHYKQETKGIELPPNVTQEILSAAERCECRKEAA